MQEEKNKKTDKIIVMKIIFFGTPEFAAPGLEILAKIPNIEISAVVTQSDKPVGRKKRLTPPPVKIAAEKLGLKVIQPKNKKQLTDLLKNTEADFFIVIAYGMILPKEALKMPKIAAINVHASLLPKYRGASPIQETLLNGDNETGISIMKMDEKLDEGPVYLIKRIKIEKTDNLQTLTTKLANLSAQILPLALEDIIDNDLTPLPQNHKETTYCKKIKKQDGKINWNKSAEEINNMIRAYTPWPSAYTEFKGKKLKILESNFEKTTSKEKPGTFFLEEKTLKIAAKSGNLLPKKLQLEGKNEMEAKAFINGHLK